ncbi:MAG TPA: ABC transporter permease [Vicinamibacterales bacterium]|nr:ABC transporter permease [Vicinamibacterales bacterium]
MTSWLRRLRARVRYRRFDDDLRRELDVHRAMSEDASVASGVDPLTARAGAARALGNMTMAREEARGVWLAPSLERVWQDVRYAVRGFRRAPAFTAFALLTLALGIGGTTAVFSVVDGVLLKPLPYPEPDRLVDVRQSTQTPALDDLPMAASQYFIFRDENRTVTDVGLYMNDAITVTRRGAPQRVSVVRATDGVLPVLGVTPALGRLFTRDDDLPNAPPVAVATFAYWRDALGSDPSAIGRSLVLNGTPTTIVGVLPRQFRFLDADDLSLVMPLRLDRGKTFIGQFNYSMVARLRPGATEAAVETDMGRMLPIVTHSFPTPPGFSVAMIEHAGFQTHVRQLKQAVVGDVGNVLWIVMGTIAFVLLIACANVGNLLLVRAEGRRRELAVRAALGAGTRRIASGLLIESLVLGLAGGALGLFVAAATVHLLVAIAPAGLPRLHEIAIDARAVLFTGGISLLAALLFGSVPVLRRANGRLSTALRSGDRSASATRTQHRTRGALVVVQVALALVVLVSSGLMIRTYRALTHVDPGFRTPASVQTFRLSIPGTEVSDREQVVHMQEDIVRRLAAIPGVASVGVANRIPMDGGGSFDPVIVKGRAYAADQVAPVRQFKRISPGFLQTLGTSLVAGRDFTWADTDNDHRVAMVSEGMARELWREPAAALGQYIRVGLGDDPWREVVGVVADVYDNGVSQAAPTTAYWPLRMDNFEGDQPSIVRNFAVAIRSDRAGTDALMTEVRQAVWASNPSLPIANVRTLDDYYRQSMARTSFTLVMLLIAGGIALLLGVVGLYSVIAYAVTQRTREIGIRAALGARPAQLASAFVRSGLWLTIIGLTGGTAAALALTRLMTSLLFGVSPFDPLTYVGVATALIATTCLASYIPARRAMQVDPAITLRQE